MSISAVRHADAEQQRIDERRAADDQAKPCSHRGQIGRDVDRVGDGEERDDGEEHRTRQPLRNVARQAGLRLPADARADDLDRRHERQA